MAKPFVAACKQYFGLKPGQTLLEFKTEVDGLTQQDKLELRPLLSAAIGEEVTVAPPPAA